MPIPNKETDIYSDESVVFDMPPEEGNVEFNQAESGTVVFDKKSNKDENIAFEQPEQSQDVVFDVQDNEKDKVKKVMQFGEAIVAKGVINKVFNHLQTSLTFTGLPSFLTELTKKEWAIDLINKGEVKVDSKTAELISKLPADQLRLVTKDIFGYHAFPLLPTTSLQRAAVKSKKGRETYSKYLDKPLYLVIDTRKWKEIYPHRRGGKNVKQKVLASGERTYISLNKTYSDLYLWATKKDENGLSVLDRINQESAEAAKQNLMGRYYKVYYRGKEGKAKAQRNPTFLSTAKLITQKGSPERVGAELAGFAMDVSIPTPLDVISTPFIKVAKPRLASAVTEAAKHAAEHEYKSVAGLAMRAVGNTKVGKAIARTLNNSPYTRWMIRSFDAGPENILEYKKTKMTASGNVGQRAVETSKTFKKTIRATEKKGLPGYKKPGIKKVTVEDDIIEKSKPVKELWRSLEIDKNVNIGKYKGFLTPDGKLYGESTDVPDLLHIAMLDETKKAGIITDNTTFSELLKNTGSVRVTGGYGTAVFDIYGGLTHQQAEFLKNYIKKVPNLNTIYIRHIDPIVEPTLKNLKYSTLRPLQKQMDGTVSRTIEIAIPPASRSQLKYVDNMIDSLIPEDMGKIIAEKPAANIKPKVFDPKKYDKMEMDFYKWLIKGKGWEEIADTLNNGGTLASHFKNDPELFAKAVGISYDTTKYVTPMDMEFIIDALENGKAEKYFDKEVLDNLRQLARETEAFKKDFGLLEGFERETAIHVPHASIGTKRVPGRLTEYKKKASFMRERAYSLWRDYAKAIMNNDKPSIPMLNVFNLMAADMQDAVNVAYQKVIEDALTESNIMIPITRKLKLPNKPSQLTSMAKKLGIKTEGKSLDQLKNAIRAELSDANRLLTEAAKPGSKEKGVTAMVNDILTAGLKDTYDPKYNLRWQIYYPYGKLRFYLKQIRREIDNKFMKGKLTDDLYEEAQKILDLIGEKIKTKADSMSIDDFEDILKDFTNKAIKEAAPEGVVAVSTNVKPYLVPSEIADTMKDETRALMSREMETFYRIARWYERGFLSVFTSKNPAFWAKYLPTDYFQMWHSGVDFWRWIPRTEQGAKVLTKKGSIVINGVRIDSKELYDAFAKAGALHQIRRLTKSEDLNVFTRQMYEISKKSKFMRTMSEVWDFPGKMLGSSDDAIRLGTGIDYIARKAKEAGIKTKEELLALVKDASDIIRKYHYVYEDIPTGFKRLRAVFPFISWYLHMVPDMLKFAFKFDKMRRLQRGLLDAEHAFGTDDDIPRPEWMEKNHNIVFKHNGKYFYIKPTIPFFQLEQFLPGGSVERMFQLGQPGLQLLLSIGDWQTFPYLSKYSDLKRDYVPLPPSMFPFIVSSKIRNDPEIQHKLGLSIYGNLNETELPYIAIKKKTVDIWHSIKGNEWAVLLDNLARNVRFFAPQWKLEADINTDYQELRKPGKQIGNLWINYGKVKATYNAKDFPVLEDMGIIHEYDPDAYTLGQLMKFADNLKKMKSISTIITKARGMKELNITPNKYQELLDDFESNIEEVGLFLDRNPEQFKQILDDIRQNLKGLPDLWDKMRNVPGYDKLRYPNVYREE